MASYTTEQAIEKYREIGGKLAATEALIEDLQASCKEMRTRQRSLANAIAWGSVKPATEPGPEGEQT